VGEDRSLAVVLRDLLPPAGPRDLLPAPTLIALAALADRLGYHSVWVPEGRGREQAAMLGAMAQATARTGLATGILPLYSRPPALAAMAAATLADLSGGRFILGIGTGHPAIIEQGYGLAFREPLRAAREFIGIVRAALSGRPISHDGRVFTVQAFQLESAPRHPVPIYLAALGPAMLRLAGEVADGVVLNWIHPERIPWALDRVHEGCRRAGRPPERVQAVCFVRAAVTDDTHAGWGALRRLAATYAAMPSYARMFEGAGFGGAMAASHSAWQSGGVETAAAALPDDFVRGLGVVGDAAACREGLRRYADAGVDVVAAYPFPVGSDPAGSLRRTIQALAPTA
jgi:5,10-methylenetetrahydromethanopterin reductase